MADIETGKRSAIRFKTNAKAWKKTVRKFVDQAKGETNAQALKRLFFRLIEKVILKTPVDTGRARGGWGAAADSLGIALPPTNPLPPKTDATDEGRELSVLEQDLKGSELRIAVTNNVAYIEFLEKGHSKQAPFGMVRISERELEMELGGRKLPASIEAVYGVVFEKMGLGRVELRAGDIGRAFGLLEGEV